MSSGAAALKRVNASLLQLQMHHHGDRVISPSAYVVLLSLWMALGLSWLESGSPLTVWATGLLGATLAAPRLLELGWVARFDHRIEGSVLFLHWLIQRARLRRRVDSLIGSLQLVAVAWVAVLVACAALAAIEANTGLPAPNPYFGTLSREAGFAIFQVQTYGTFVGLWALSSVAVFRRSWRRAERTPLCLEGLITGAEIAERLKADRCVNGAFLVVVSTVALELAT